MRFFSYGQARVAFCSILVLALCGACTGRKPESAPETSGVRARLGGFALSTSGPADEITPSLAYKGADITQTGETVRAVDPEQEVRNFPLPGCRSMKVEMFTGGANCCFRYYLLSECPDGSHAAYIEPRDGGMGAANASMRAYTMDDAAFFYYSPAGQTADQSGDAPFSFSRAESPRITRYIVYENGEWRPDRPGEFKAAYRSLRAQAVRGEGVPGAKAVMAAYYSLMAGDAEDTAMRTLSMNLPGKYRKLSPGIFADIKKAVADFNPVKNLDLPR